MKTIVLAHLCVIRARPTVTRNESLCSVHLAEACLSLKINFMLLAADATARALLQATDHGVIQGVGGSVKMFSYGKPTLSVLNAAEVLAEMFL